MNEEILENLLIDRALGQLSPDVLALLDDYLARNPDASRIAAELDDTVTLAGDVLRNSIPRVKPPACFEAPPALIPFRAALAMAASFAVGAGIMWISLQQEFPRSSPSSPTLPIVEYRAPIPSSTRTTYAQADPSLRSLPFWSKERAFLLSRNSGASN